MGQWLPQYKNEMFFGARNNNMCSYLIALEAWRRGLKVTFYAKKLKRNRVHAPGRLYSISDGNKTHFFYKAKGDKVSRESVLIAANKQKTKSLLREHGVPVPKGSRFSHKQSDEVIYEYGLNEIGLPLVIKPTNGVQGKGVIANITDKEQFKDAINYLRNELKYKDVMIEEFIEGDEYRFFVVGNEVKAIINRTPANVIGDGVSSISELIKKKNIIRKKNPRLYNCLIKIDYELKKTLHDQNLTLKDVPSENQQIMLRSKSNISTGGDSEDKLNSMPDEIKKLAINALKALPCAPHGGVDIIVNFEGNSPTGKVIEINGIPQIGSLVFPMKGSARDIPSIIMDLYFPETKDKERINDWLYFDFRSVLAPLRNNLLSEVSITPPPFLKEYQRVQYKVAGTIKRPTTLKWIQRKAIENDLIGFVSELDDETLEIVVAGKEDDITNFNKTCLVSTPYLEVSEIVEAELSKPLKIGFEIIKNKIKNNTKQKKVYKTEKNKTIVSRIKRKIKRILS